MNKEVMAFLISAMTLLAGSVSMFQAPNTKLEAVAATPAAEIPEEIVRAFENWKVEYGRQYTSNDYEEYRLRVFMKNFNMIEQHNTNPENSYRMAANQFMDMTQEEFIATYLTLKVDEEKTKDVKVVESAQPNAIDWSAAGKVTAVKNQGSCGSCWAFSSTGVLESWALITGRGNHNFSEQQLVDCSRSYGNQGCNGGWPTSALNYVRDHGITEQGAYPYTGRDGACRAQGGAFRISGHKDVPAGNCNAVSQALGGSPLSVCVDASNWSFYHSGVFRNCAANINHAVLLTGQDGSGNWQVKNSWGTGWGAGGYITLAPGNTCGVCLYATVPY